MRILRHLVAIGIIAGFAYLYVQQQKQPARVELASEQFDPFENWDDVGGAPAFDAAPAFNASSEPAERDGHSDVPQPIPFSVAGSDDVLADLTNWSESVNDDIQSRLDGAHQQATQTLQNTKDKAQSLWNEPGKAIQRSPRQNSGLANSDTKRNSAPTAKPADIARKIPESIRNAVDQFGTETDDVKSHVVRKPAAPGENQTPAKVTAKPLAYREFTLGVGPRATACVIDPSVSRDGLLLSSLFTGLRREWTSDLDRNREQRLVLLVGQPNAAGDSNLEELQNRLKQANASRVVHLVRSDDSRGWLRFTSEQESIDALMSVPGVYRIEADSAIVHQLVGSQNMPAVRIELPRDIGAQEPATVNLVSAALLGNWTNRPDMPYSSQMSQSMKQPASAPEQNSPAKTNSENAKPTQGQQGNAMTKTQSGKASGSSAGQKADEDQTTSSFFAELYQGKQSPVKNSQSNGKLNNKGEQPQTENVPAPPSQKSPQRIMKNDSPQTPQQSLTTKTEEATNGLLGQAESIWNQFVGEADKATSDVKENVQRQLADVVDKVPPPIDLLPDPASDVLDSNVAEKLQEGIAAEGLAKVKTVDMLPPPPAFTPRPDVTSIDPNAFFKLPPPPPGK
ncbi:MAG: hypothetical protein ACE37I_13485 [Rubinisphaera brasiliensis]|uniref:hypothetical protein n=1 Tax=Rubinisphaera brasiliensis TaxID=119 RepID=UPI003919A21E